MNKMLSSFFENPLLLRCEMTFNVESFQNLLLRWFQNNGRELPWRKDYSPYHVWLSEILLQQTQMERGVIYFQRWLERFPDIKAVAAAESGEILKYWEGLGYYARARNLHKAAKVMVEKFHGQVPSDYKDLLNLPGVGLYTAAAIASIAFEADIGVIDANVERIFARIFDISEPIKSKAAEKTISTLMDEILPIGKARYFNQALMDLGGVICRPRNPECGICPVRCHCAAYCGSFVEDRPVKVERQKQIVIEMSTGILVHKGYIFIQQRQENDIWGGLWEFPGGRLKENETAVDALIREYKEETGFTIELCEKITSLIHFYTKYKVILNCYRCRLAQESILPQLNAAKAYHWVEKKMLESYAFPAGHRKCIEFVLQNCPDIFEKDC